MFLLPLTLARQSFVHPQKYLPVIVATALIHQHAMHAPITNGPVANDWRMTFDNRLGGALSASFAVSGKDLPFMAICSG